ncbi:hypothetical protein DDI74_19270 [Chryseobacterium gleum]|nr:hypothetical protein DDI74_19270 [Chryseobacterium gleum]
MVVCSKIIKNGKRRFLYNLYSCIGKVFQNDSINLGFYVKSPEDYLDDEAASQVDQYLKQYEDQFPERTACYFDAKSHGFPSIQCVDIDLYNQNLWMK